MERNNKIGSIIVTIIGVALIVVGAIVLIKNAIADIPHMGEDGWFDASSKQGFGIFGGIAMCMIGVFVTFAGTLPRLAKNAKTLNQNSAETIFDVIKDVTGSKDQYCDYCGSQLSKGKTKCDSCGAVKTKK